MINVVQCIVILRDRDDRGLARLDWNPMMGLCGAFVGNVDESGEVVSWIMRAPAGWTRGVFGKPFRVEDGFQIAMDQRDFEDGGRVSSASAPKGPLAIEHPVFLDSPLLTAKPARTYDLSPLANLATAVVWGLALERVVTEWRAWHPAARVTWDLEGGMNGPGSTSLRVSYAIDGIGPVLNVVTNVAPYARLQGLSEDVEDAKFKAAMAMAPFYVAPKAKPENRDAALRRFADGVRR